MWAYTPLSLLSRYKHAPHISLALFFLSLFLFFLFLFSYLSFLSPRLFLLLQKEGRQEGRDRRRKKKKEKEEENSFTRKEEGFFIRKERKLSISHISSSPPSITHPHPHILCSTTLPPAHTHTHTALATLHCLLPPPSHALPHLWEWRIWEDLVFCTALFHTFLITILLKMGLGGTVGAILPPPLPPALWHFG